MALVKRQTPSPGLACPELLAEASVKPSASRNGSLFQAASQKAFQPTSLLLAHILAPSAPEAHMHLVFTELQWKPPTSLLDVSARRSSKTAFEEYGLLARRSTNGYTVLEQDSAEFQPSCIQRHRQQSQRVNSLILLVLRRCHPNSKVRCIF